MLFTGVVFAQQTQPVVISHATVLTAAGAVIEDGYVVLEAGKISALGKGEPPVLQGALQVDGRKRFVTPGLIDTHSHMGVYPIPNMQAHEDGNEMSAPTTPEVWAEHAFWPQDPALGRAVAAGITTVQVLPGSANLIGGRSFVAKLVPHTSARAMRFPGAPQGLKMACGENPKRTHGEHGGPQTRMGNVAGYRKAFQKALEYQRAWKKYEEALVEKKDKKSKDKEPPTPPDRDLGLETLVKVLQGEILVHNHCYRADEMHIMLDIAQEFGFKIRSFHHALEAYKLADRLAQEEVSCSTWADWWGFKMEALDGIPYNAAMLSKKGVRAIIHSDSESEIRHLNHEAAKAMAAGRRAGISLSENEVLRWLTANPAWALGVDAQTGTLEVGKMADVVVWNGHPFSVYSLVDEVFIDGVKQYDRTHGGVRQSDFEWGQAAGLKQ